MKLETFNWNKTSKSDQDKAILFMLRVISELEQGRKHGYDSKFYAMFP